MNERNPEAAKGEHIRDKKTIMIISPVPSGNGAFVVHSQLQQHLPNYQLVPYSPRRTFFPPSLYPLGRGLPARLLHVVPDSAIFHLRRNIPVVLTLHGYAIDRGFSRYSSLLQNIHGRTDLRWLHRAAIWRADRITAVSRFTAELAKKDLGISKSVEVIYNGVDEQLFTPARRSAGKEIRVLFSGNLTRRKGAHWLLPIAERLGKNIVIYYTSGLREKSQLFDHPQLRALGKVPHENMPDVYRSMDILLFPTVREGFGLAAVEAMACGLPVVATNTSALPEVISDGQGGILCPLGDVESFADAIQALADNVAMRNQMGEFNRGEVEQRFTLPRMIMGYRQLFDQTMES